MKALASRLVILALAIQSTSTHAASIDAAAFFVYGNSSFTSGGPPTPIFTDTSVVPSVADAYDSGFQASPSLEYRVESGARQGYGVFGAGASAYMKRLGPYDFEYFQSFATGTFKETMTIDAPVGVSNGSTGRLMLGWDITGGRLMDDSSSSYLSISAHTSASLPDTSSFVVGIDDDGHYQLQTPIAFIFGTPFELTVDSFAFAGTGYDYRFTPAPTQFTGFAAASYSNTAILSFALISDAAGTPYPDAAIITQSGNAFPVVVPEPNSSVLLFVGATILAIRAGKRRWI